MTPARLHCRVQIPTKGLYQCLSTIGDFNEDEDRDCQALSLGKKAGIGTETRSQRTVFSWMCRHRCWWNWSSAWISVESQLSKFTLVVERQVNSIDCFLFSRFQQNQQFRRKLSRRHRSGSILGLANLCPFAFRPGSDPRPLSSWATAPPKSRCSDRALSEASTKIDENCINLFNLSLFLFNNWPFLGWLFKPL